MNRARTVIVLVMLIVLAVTLTGAFLTRGVMADLPFLQARKGSWTGAYVPLGIVDQRPWQTAATLAALAQSAEEKKFARDAERLADHEVDQAFSQSLRQASLAQPKLSDKGNRARRFRGRGCTECSDPSLIVPDSLLKLVDPFLQC